MIAHTLYNKLEDAQNVDDDTRALELEDELTLLYAESVPTERYIIDEVFKILTGYKFTQLENGM